jgi:hypothetical protein
MFSANNLGIMTAKFTLIQMVRKPNVQISRPSFLARLRLRPKTQAEEFDLTTTPLAFQGH